MVAGAISAVASVLQLSFLFGRQDEESPLGMLGSLAATILALIGALLLHMGASRQREYLDPSPSSGTDPEAARL